MKNIFKTIGLFCLLVILSTCRKDKLTEEEKLTQHEQKIIAKIDDFMPMQIVSMYENYFSSNRSGQDYVLYLDSIETAIDELKNAIQLNFSFSEYQKAMSNSLLNLQNQKKSSNDNCLGLGFAKGVKIDVGVSGRLGLGIVAGLQAAGGGGVKIIYDFVNLDRQVYYYTFCSSGYTFGVGFAAILKASVGFSGVNELITGIKYHDNSSGLNKFEGTGLSESYSLNSTLATVFGINFSIGVGTSTGAEADFSGIINLGLCPLGIVAIENGTKGYSFTVSGTLSPAIGTEISMAYSSNTIASYSYGAADTYKKFEGSRPLAASRMATEILFTGPIPGISSVLSPIDLAASTVAIIYGLKNFSSCPAQIPSIGTKAISSITSTSATSGGIITNNGGSSVTTRGIVWSTSVNPTINDKIGMTIDGQGIGDFASNITSLAANTTYHVRAYSTNSAGTAYGRDLTFTTLVNIIPPAVEFQTITLNERQSYHFSTNTFGWERDGDFYVGSDKFWANNLGQKGLHDLGDLGNISLTEVSIPESGYIWGGVDIYVNHVYVALPREGEEGKFIIFRVITKTSSSVTINGFIKEQPGLEVTYITVISPNGGEEWSSGTEHKIIWTSTKIDKVNIYYVIEGWISWNLIKSNSNASDGSYTWMVPNTPSNKCRVMVNSSTYEKPAVDHSDNLFTISASATIPTLTTTAASGITQTTATSGGNVTSDGGATVTAHGVCWSTSSNPTIALSTKTTDGTGTGAFTSSLTGLTANTTYYVRAYATNSVGTAYGSELSFATLAEVVPTLTITSLFSITSTTAISGGIITSDGGSSITARGVCWSTSANPTIALSTKTTDGTGIGSFTSSITGLIAGTTYYVRAYATNSVGTAYGTQRSFTTSVDVPNLTTTAASSQIPPLQVEEQSPMMEADNLRDN